MKIIFDIEPEDISIISNFISNNRNNTLVQERIRRNVNGNYPEINKGIFWTNLVDCLLSSQQKSSPNSPIKNFLNEIPFPLSYEICFDKFNNNYLETYSYEILSNYGGIRFINKIPKLIQINLSKLENGYWEQVFERISALENSNINVLEKEREFANWIDDNFKGFGPKQSRNLLQLIGLTKYEIPIDSRVINWLNNNRFPIKLSSYILSDKALYEFILDCIIKLCSEIDEYPCVLDAAIFSSYDL